MLISEFHEQCAYEKHKNDSRKYSIDLNSTQISDP